jgi:hypothetical protein
MIQRAEFFDARPQAPLDVIFKAGPVRAAIDLHRAGAKLKISVDQIERLPRKRRRQVRPVVTRPVFYDLARDDCAGRLLVCDLDMRVLLIVFEQNVERRLVLFDQIAF